MLNYMITEGQRADLMEALETARWGLGGAIQEARDEGTATDVIETLSAERAAYGYLWDTLNQMQPTNI